ncbi:hypothetical protein N7463_000475 [Penicillium fimorum]|uniref:Uncharacterized protein n=1 Tax=Penicillium fimorum TaxID=1882269 RepID=A0A9W9Y4B8_9EURO|nr:hypothetical protein N7463_000475 [Penicillium fimorum]
MEVLADGPRPIPSPSDAQLEELFVLTNRAHARAAACNQTEHEITCIQNTLGAALAADKLDLEMMLERALENGRQCLIQLDAEDEDDNLAAINIWKQVG